jgi:hypothetical protein
LRHYLEASDVDGILVMPANDSQRTASRQIESAPLRNRLHAARAQVRSRRWRLFSRLLESSLPGAPAAAISVDAIGNSGTDACEESVEVS